MGKAVGYVINQWSAIQRFVEDGALPNENTACEREARPIAVGRRNYLLVGADSGGERAATIYTILGTCRLQGIDAATYLNTSVLYGIFAHELAHHMYGDSAAMCGHFHAMELRADCIAGQVIALVGITPDHFARAIEEISWYASDTHPAGSHRVQAICRGYCSRVG